MPRYSRYGRGSRYGLRSYRGRYSGTFKSGRYGSMLRGTSRVSSIARAVAGLQAHARRVGNPERKWYDQKDTQTLIPPTSAVEFISDFCSNFQTGAGASGTSSPASMIGNRVTIDSIQIQGVFSVVGTGGPPPVIDTGSQSLRFVLYEDTDPDGSAANLSDIFAIDPAVSQVTTYSMRNMSYATRFKILWDHKFNLTSEGMMAHSFNKYFKIGRQIQFATNGSGNVVAGTVGTNRSFGYVVVIDGPTAVNNNVYVVNTRLRYTDN